MLQYCNSPQQNVLINKVSVQRYKEPCKLVRYTKVTAKLEVLQVIDNHQCKEWYIDEMQKVREERHSGVQLKLGCVIGAK